MKVYISGPYTPKTNNIHDAARIAHQNVKKAIAAALEVIKLGHYPFVPHLTHFIHIENDSPTISDFWYSYDLVWLECCDAILLLDGWSESRGCRLELAKAEELGLKIFYGLESFKEFIIQNRSEKKSLFYKR